MDAQPVARGVGGAALKGMTPLIAHTGCAASASLLASIHSRGRASAPRCYRDAAKRYLHAYAPPLPPRGVTRRSDPRRQRHRCRTLSAQGHPQCTCRGMFVPSTSTISNAKDQHYRGSRIASGARPTQILLQLQEHDAPVGICIEARKLCGQGYAAGRRKTAISKA